ncbi:MAG TPA: TPM domain-containing protein [Candidatus Acidoferrales bacterium]|nr:TPM domain-containing protein [Candidatus Acidoferrales bacterium]
MGPARIARLALLGALVAFLAAAPLVRAQSVDQVAAQAKLGYVTDLAGVLSQSGKNQLTALCTEVQQKTQAQIAVVTIKSLGGDSIDGYAPDLFAKIGVGPKSTDRGVLILFAVEDRQYRTEVGYGLESILPDGKVGGFGREAVPYLRQGNYDAAILLVTRRVADTIADDRHVALSGSAPPSFPFRPRPISPFVPLLFLFFFIFVFVPIVIAISRAAKKGAVGGGRVYRGGGGNWWIGPMMGGGGFSGGGGGGFGGGFGGGGFGGGGGGFGGFGGGMSGGGGASGSW